MALVFCDSFDHYDDADILDKWTGGGGAIAGAGRNGTSSLRLTTTGAFVSKAFGAPLSTLVCGFAYKTINMPSGQRFFSIRDAGTIHIDLIHTVGALLQVRRGGVTVLGTGTTVLSSNVFYYIEVKVTIHNSTGSVIVKLNGVEEINVSGIDTQNTANATADEIYLECSGSQDTDHDDLYLCSTAGGAPTNDFLGDVRVESIFPNGNGNSSAFDGSDGNQVDNYLLVDEPLTIDDDTTYVESPDVGDKDTYAYGNLTSTAGTVAGIQMLPHARKTDAGVRSIVSVARLSATEVDSAAKTLSTGYTYYPDIRETKPGGGAWTISDVNSAEFGQKVAA